MGKALASQVRGTVQPNSDYMYPAVLLHTSPLTMSELCAYMDYQTATKIKIFKLPAPLKAIFIITLLFGVTKISPY
jgi:hypothetical protein